MHCLHVHYKQRIDIPIFTQSRNFKCKILRDFYFCFQYMHNVYTRSRFTKGLSLGNLSKDVFERRTSSGSEAFSPYIGLDADKFVLLSFFSLTKTIYPRAQPNHCPMMEKVHFRLTSVAQKRCCLSSLLVTALFPHVRF